MRALRGVSLGARSGEILAVFGANGAGKSTLLRCLASLARPDAGEIFVGGETLAGAAAARLRARIGTVTHQTLLYDSLTAEENLVFYGSLYGVSDPPARARELLSEFGLSTRAGDAVRGFSRGMQQRLALARALMHDPEVLLLDEPATGLDPSAAESFTARLTSLRASGRAGIVVSHDLRSALAVADRYAVLTAGRLVEEGPASGTDPERLARKHFKPRTYREGAGARARSGTGAIAGDTQSGAAAR